MPGPFPLSANGNSRRRELAARPSQSCTPSAFDFQPTRLNANRTDVRTLVAPTTAAARRLRIPRRRSRTRPQRELRPRGGGRDCPRELRCAKHRDPPSVERRQRRADRPAPFSSSRRRCRSSISARGRRGHRSTVQGERCGRPGDTAPTSSSFLHDSGYTAPTFAWRSWTRFWRTI